MKLGAFVKNLGFHILAQNFRCQWWVKVPPCMPREAAPPPRKMQQHKVIYELDKRDMP